MVKYTGTNQTVFSRENHEAQILFIAGNPQVRDVLLSGGDPLTLPQRVL